MELKPRVVSPTFHAHRGLFEIEQVTKAPVRLAYLALCSCCDRAGRFEWDAEALRAAVLPHDGVPLTGILYALAFNLHVVQYVVDGRSYGWIPTMPTHQPPGTREAVEHPAPAPCVVSWYQSAKRAQLAGEKFEEPNPLSDQPLPPGTAVTVPTMKATTKALPAIKGRRNVDAIITRLSITLDEVVSGARPQLAREQWRKVAAEFVFAYWARLYEKPAAFLSENDKREARIVARMKENGDDLNEILYALDGGKRSPFLQGKNEEKTVYDGLETLLRDRAQVEKLSALAPKFKTGEIHPALVRYAGVLLGLGAPDSLRARLNGEATQ